MVSDSFAPQDQSLRQYWHKARQRTLEICQPLEIEDYIPQAMPDVSPPKWHLAHTTWFFETFLLLPYLPDYVVYHPAYRYLFNSYYEGVGPFWQRSHRGDLSRPTVKEVLSYRSHVDQAMDRLWEIWQRQGMNPEARYRVQVGCHHEEQHQELLLTDIKFNLSVNPLAPAYRQPLSIPPSSTIPLEMIPHPGGLLWIGQEPPEKTENGIPATKTGGGFPGFDNEFPRHRQFLEPFEIANRPVTNGEFREFLEAGGYQDFQWWLSDGWDWCRRENRNAPLYWISPGGDNKGDWQFFGLEGRQVPDWEAPVCHISFYEADAYARWRGFRLPTEAEWEVAAGQFSAGEGNFFESGWWRPRMEAGPDKNWLGNVWEWTQSSYLPYPGFQMAPGALGEYNGKFMSGQRVLRGGSCFTSREHIRLAYRNFFQPDKCWQMSGFRLARTLT